MLFTYINVNSIKVKPILYCPNAKPYVQLFTSTVLVWAVITYIKV